MVLYRVARVKTFGLVGLIGRCAQAFRNTQFPGFWLLLTLICGVVDGMKAAFPALYKFISDFPAEQYMAKDAFNTNQIIQIAGNPYEKKKGRAKAGAAASSGAPAAAGGAGEAPATPVNPKAAGAPPAAPSPEGSSPAASSP